MKKAALRQRRWADFQQRVSFAPRDVYRHSSGGWLYIPIHPFGGEPERFRFPGERSDKIAR